MKLLKDIKVIDLGRFITAPLAAQLLGELGADVIKVESPRAIDPFRGNKGHFQSANRNKRSVVLDFATNEGKQALYTLIEKADVILLNMRPRAVAKLGLSYEQLIELNPKLVHCSITGFGADGPYADRPAFDNVAQALSGWLSMFHQGKDPRVSGPPVSDMLGGVFACIGVLGALVERATSGKGRKVEVSMLASMISFATEPLSQLSANGVPPPFFSRASFSQSYVVTCKDGRRIGLHMSSPEKFWKSLAAAIGRDDLFERNSAYDQRVQNYEVLAQELAATFMTRPRDEWLPLLEKHDVPAAPERRLDELQDDPQVKHLDIFYQMIDPTGGAITAAKRAIRYDGSNDSGFLPPPTFGEHSDEILGQAGFTAAQIAKFREAGIVR